MSGDADYRQTHSRSSSHAPDQATASSAAAAVQPPSSSSIAAGTPQHKRVYQACIPCRRRKVKCDLGSVDNPNSPPCVRCRRESKECFFSATRRKRKTDAEGSENGRDSYDAADDYVVRNGRKRVHIEGIGSAYVDEELLIDRPLTPGGHLGRSQPLRRPQAHDAAGRHQSSTDDTNTQLENPEAQDVMRQEIYGPTDALDLLYKSCYKWYT